MKESRPWHFLHSVATSPGSPDDKPFTDLIRKLLKRDPSTLELSCMRRLFNESYANVEATDETPARRLAPAERASRLKVSASLDTMSLVIH